MQYTNYIIQIIIFKVQNANTNTIYKYNISTNYNVKYTIQKLQYTMQELQCTIQRLQYAI